MDLEINSRLIELDSEKQIMIKNIVNLSSMNSTDLIDTLESIIKVKKNINILRINSFTMKVTEDRTFGKSGKPILVWYIVDEDDKMKHIKIRNINMMNNYMKVGMITFKLESSSANKMLVTGKEQRIVTSQIMDESAKVLGAHKKLMKNNLSSVVIVQLDNDLISGVAALTVQLNRLSVPFVIMKNSYQKFVTWLLLTEKQLKKIEADRTKIVDSRILNSKNWAYIMEGTELLVDNGEIVYFKVSDKKQKRKLILPEKFKNIMNDVINAIKSIMTKILTYASEIVKRIKNFVGWKNKHDVNKKTIGKIKIKNKSKKQK